MALPSGQLQSDAVAAFKQQLGIGAAEDSFFGWIAEVGLQSPLPPRWTSHTDSESGFVYYVDHDRQTSCWENPLVPWLRQVVEIGRAYLENPSETFFEDQKAMLWHQHKHELDNWHGPFTDEEGRKYYVNAAEGVSSWQDPRVEAQYVFELESGLLTSLEEVLPAPPGQGGNNDPFVTDDGAEVLTFGGTATSFFGRKGRGKTTNMLLTQATMKAKEEHKSTLDKMSGTVERLRTLQSEDVEAQRLQFSRKVEARKNRRKQKARLPQHLPPLMEQPNEHAAQQQLPPPRLQRRITPPALDTLGDDASPPMASPPPPPVLDNDVPPTHQVAIPEGDDSTATSTRHSTAGVFKPPSQPPSPLAGKTPVVPADVEHMLRRSPKADDDGPRIDHRPSCLGKLELRGLPEDAEAAGLATLPRTNDFENTRKTVDTLS